MKKLSITTILCFIILFIISCGGTDTKTDDRLTTAKSVAEGETIAKSIPEVETTAKSIPVGEVAIGTQTWTSKNLDVSKFRNGEAIPLAKTNAEWELAGENMQPAWCYYENKTANGTIYGKLYNWYAVNDPRGLVPKGYHIPTDEEWTILTDYLGGEKLAGAKMKSTSGWENNGNGNNTSGYAGLPGGFRLYNGSFLFIGFVGLLWSSSEYDDSNARNIGLSALAYDGSEFYRNHGSKQDGHSVRCLRDGPRHYKCNSCQWTGTKLNNLSQCPHCTSDNISSSFTTHFYK